jgi:hypothetical protein
LFFPEWVALSRGFVMGSVVVQIALSLLLGAASAKLRQVLQTVFLRLLFIVLAWLAFAGVSLGLFRHGDLIGWVRHGGLLSLVGMLAVVGHLGW